MLRINKKICLEVIALLIGLPIIIAMIIFYEFINFLSSIFKEDLFPDNNDDDDDDDLLNEKHDSDWRRNLREINK